MKRNLSLILCVISFLNVFYFFIAHFWINKTSFSSLVGRDFNYVIFWIVLFFMSLGNYYRLKKQKTKIRHRTIEVYFKLGK
jgi:hypothetical protein